MPIDKEQAEPAMPLYGGREAPEQHGAIAADHEGQTVLAQRLLHERLDALHHAKQMRGRDDPGGGVPLRGRRGQGHIAQIADLTCRLQGRDQARRPQGRGGTGDPRGGPRGVIGRPDQPDTHAVRLLSLLAVVRTGRAVRSRV
jgi:hypothetical protein